MKAILHVSGDGLRVVEDDTKVNYITLAVSARRKLESSFEYRDIETSCTVICSAATAYI